MAVTLVNDLTGMFRSQALGEASAQLGESENSVLRGFQTSAAAILGGLASRGGQPGFLRQVYELITNPSNDGGILNNIRGIISGRTQTDGLGARMLSLLFGSDQSKVADEISQASGLRPSSAATMMGIAAPVVIGVLGKRVHDDHLDASGLSTLLQSESSEVRSVLPANLMNSVRNATAAVGETAGRVRDTAASAASNAASTVESGYRSAVESRPASTRWLWPLLLGALCLIAIMWLLGRNRETSRVAQQAGDAMRSGAGAAGDAARSSAANLGNFFHSKLPNGVDLNIPSNGMEAHLIAFIANPAQGINPNQWFEFDRVTFETNSATLRPDSQEELNNIAAILKAYPPVHIRIGGYTDNSGDPQANLRLSQERADSVMQQLTAMGVAPDRMDAKGYGEDHPIADNSTEEGRARNRRVAILVTQK